MKTSSILLLLLCAFSCTPTRNAEKNSDHAKLQGVWLAQSESVNGITKEVNFQYIFREHQITFIDETGKEMKYSFTLNTSNKPRLLTIVPADPLSDPTPVSVGYELNGRSLKIVVAPAGLRPTDISDNNNQELITCRRKGS